MLYKFHFCVTPKYSKKCRFHTSHLYSVNRKIAVRAVLGWDSLIKELHLNQIGNDPCWKTGPGSYFREQCWSVYLCEILCVCSLWLKSQIWFETEWYVRWASGQAHSTTVQDRLIVFPHVQDICFGSVEVVSHWLWDNCCEIPVFDDFWGIILFCLVQIGRALGLYITPAPPVGGGTPTWAKCACLRSNLELPGWAASPGLVGQLVLVFHEGDCHLWPPPC